MALCPCTYITAPNGIHRQQVVAMAKLKLDHLLSCPQVTQFLLLGMAALLDQVFQQQGIFTHPLDWLQQVRRQVHLVPELQLFVLDTYTVRINTAVSHSRYFCFLVYCLQLNDKLGMMRLRCCWLINVEHLF